MSEEKFESIANVMKFFKDGHFLTDAYNYVSNLCEDAESKLREIDYLIDEMLANNGQKSLDEVQELKLKFENAQQSVNQVAYGTSVVAQKLYEFATGVYNATDDMARSYKELTSDEKQTAQQQGVAEEKVLADKQKDFSKEYTDKFAENETEMTSLKQNTNVFLDKVAEFDQTALKCDYAKIDNALSVAQMQYADQDIEKTLLQNIKEANQIMHLDLLQAKNYLDYCKNIEQNLTQNDECLRKLNDNFVQIQEKSTNFENQKQ